MPSSQPLSRAGADAPLDLVQAQLAAIEAWHRAQPLREAAERSGRLTREMRLDLDRRRTARRREQAALIARADAHLRESGALLEPPPRTRAVIAHRSPWLRSAVATRLEQHGVSVVGEFEDGADAAGAVVVEQPDLLLVEDRLPSLPGADVVRRACSFSPRTVVGAQVLDSSGVAPLVDAGAQAVFTRRIRPADIADQLLACLGDRPTTDRRRSSSRSSDGHHSVLRRCADAGDDRAQQGT